MYALHPTGIYSDQIGPCRFGHQVLSAFNHTFRTHIFSVSLPSFSSKFQSLIKATLEPYLDTEESRSRGKEHPADLRLWAGFECLGMLERSESLISSVFYEAIDEHVWARRLLITASRFTD